MNYIDSNGCNYGNPDTVQWQKRPFADISLTDEQMDIFNRSYNPDWECRYYPIKFGDCHYLLRSGFWVCKFIYVKGDDGLYHISEFYSSPDKNDHFARMLEIFREGYWRFRSKGPQKTDDYFGVKPPKKDPIIGTVVKRIKLYKELIANVI